MYLSLTVVLFVLLTYFLIGRYIIEEKKIFTIQFFYIAFYFSLAPFLHFYNDFYAADLFFNDFNSALFDLNLINSLGLIFAFLGFILFSKVKFKKNNISININYNLVYKISFTYFILALIYFIYLSFTTNIFYVEAKAELESSLFEYMILESTSIIFAWGLISYIKFHNKKKFIPYFILFLIVTILFAGLRGSRVTIIFNIVNFLLLYSYLIRAINWKSFFPLLIVGFIFNSVYSNYKYAGIEGVKNYFLTGEKSSYISSKENENLHFLLGDLGRSDVQAKIIENINYNQYQPSYMPETYIKGLTSMLPDKMTIQSFESKRILGTEALYGFKGNDDYSSSRIYGLLGEGLINFGFFAIPFIFFVYGCIHVLCLNLFSFVKNSKYILFLPLLFFMPIYIIFYDIDNIVFQILKNWTIPFLIFLIFNIVRK